MDRMPLLAVIFQAIPESLVLAWTALVLYRVKFKARHVIIAGVSVAIFVCLVRAAPFTFGIHFILSIFAMSFALSWSTRLWFGDAFSAVIVTYAIFAIIEAIVLWLVIGPLTTEILNSMWQDTWLRIRMGLISPAILAAITAAVIWRRRKTGGNEPIRPAPDGLEKAIRECLEWPKRNRSS